MSIDHAARRSCLQVKVVLQQLTEQGRAILFEAVLEFLVAAKPAFTLTRAGGAVGLEPTAYGL